MTRYRKVSTCIHGDDKVSQLSRPKKANGRDLWFYLLTGPHTTSLPGLFRAGIAQLAEENGWKTRATAIVFDEILSLGLAKYDAKARVAFLPKAIKHNAPEGPNTVRSWRQHYDELPDSPLKVEALQVFRAFLEEYETAHPPKRPDQSRLGAFRDTFPEAFRDAIPDAIADAKGDLARARDQEQEQEQEQEVRKNGAAAAARASGPAEPPEGQTALEPPPLGPDGRLAIPDGLSFPAPPAPAARDAPKERVIEAVIRKTGLQVVPTDDVTEDDLVEAAKTRCAKAGVPYSTRTVTAALASERHKQQHGLRRSS